MQGYRYLRTMLPGYTVYLSDCTYFTRFASRAQYRFPFWPYDADLYPRTYYYCTLIALLSLHGPEQIQLVYLWSSVLRPCCTNYPRYRVEPKLACTLGRIFAYQCRSASMEDRLSSRVLAYPSQTPDFVVAVITKLFSTSRALYTIGWGWIYIDCIRPALCRMVCT